MYAIATIYGVQHDTGPSFTGLPAAVGNVGSWSSPSYWNWTVYFWAQNDHLKAFPLVGGLLSTAPTRQSTELYGFPGDTPSISANGTADALVWTINASGYGVAAGELQAHSAANVAIMLYTSQKNYARNVPGGAVKFRIPTVANVKVRVGASQEVDFYGLLSTVPVAAAEGYTTSAVGSAA